MGKQGEGTIITPLLDDLPVRSTDVSIDNVIFFMPWCLVEAKISLLKFHNKFGNVVEILFVTHSELAKKASRQFNGFLGRRGRCYPILSARMSAAKMRGPTCPLSATGLSTLGHVASVCWKSKVLLHQHRKYRYVAVIVIVVVVFVRAL